MKNIFKLIVAVVLSELAGIIGSVFTISAIPNWYSGIVKPALNPPSWVFGPVWTTLYVLMGISAFLIWSSYAEASASAKDPADKSEDKKKEIKIALGVFGVQLF